MCDIIILKIINYVLTQLFIINDDKILIIFYNILEQFGIMTGIMFPHLFSTDGFSETCIIHEGQLNYKVKNHDFSSYQIMEFIEEDLIKNKNKIFNFYYGEEIDLTKTICQQNDLIKEELFYLNVITLLENKEKEEYEFNLINFLKPKVDLNTFIMKQDPNCLSCHNQNA